MKKTWIAAASALAVAGMAATAADAWTTSGAPASENVRASAPASESVRASAPASGTVRASAPDYRAIVRQQGPAVVGITVAGTRTGQDNADDDRPLPPFFRGLPGWQMPQLPQLPQPPQGALPFRGQGSGFIVSADGIVLTNAHVVDGARQVTVRLSDRREFTAKVLGSDPTTDIAVLKIDATGLPTVATGNSHDLAVGDPVLAIGSPYGFEQTATQGIVSAKGRSLPGDGLVPFIQTDAAINPGNSGGPLFDAQGRVVGVNAQIWSRSGGFQGLAFAIPIDVALHVKRQIVEHGKVEHARLGVSLQDLSAPLAASFGLERPDGALVADVVPDSAAARAGLRSGDVITAIDGRPVTVAGDVSSRIGLARPGQGVQLTLWRDKAPREIAVTLGKADAGRLAQRPSDEDGPSLGLSVRPLAPQERRQAGLDHGLLIQGVDGPAQWAGVQPGDVLLAVNGRPVDGIDQVREVLRKRPKQVALLLARDGQRLFVPVVLG
jgi:serine protease Do